MVGRIGAVAAPAASCAVGRMEIKGSLNV